MADRPFGGKALWTPVPWYPLPYMQLWLDSIKGHVSSTTYDGQRRSLSYFGQFAQAEGIRHPEELDRIHILRYQAWLMKDAKSQRGQVPSRSYRRRLLLGLKQWIAWLEAEGHITKTPWERIVIGGNRKKISKPLNDGEVLTVFEAHRRQAFSLTPFVFHRRETLLALMFAWGLKNNEILALNVPNMDFRRESITIRFGQNERFKTLPYGEDLKGVVARWLQQRSRYAKPTDDALFIDTSGLRMSRRNLIKTVDDLGDRSGVDLSSTRLRNTYGAHLLRAGVERKVVKDLLGLVSQANVTLYDPLAQEKKDALEPINDELAELLNLRRPDPEYRRIQ